MKTKDKKELSTRSIEELKTKLKEARGNLFSLRISLSQNKLKNKREVFYKRKEIALIKTIIREKELIKNEKTI